MSQEGHEGFGDEFLSERVKVAVVVRISFDEGGGALGGAFDFMVRVGGLEFGQVKDFGAIGFAQELVKLLAFFISVYVPGAFERNRHVQPLYFWESSREALHGGPISFEECLHIRFGVKVNIAKLMKGDVSDFAESGIHPIFKRCYFLGGVTVVVRGEVGEARLSEGGGLVIANDAQVRVSALKAFKHVVAHGVMSEEDSHIEEADGFDRGGRGGGCGEAYKSPYTVEEEKSSHGCLRFWP